MILSTKILPLALMLSAAALSACSSSRNNRPRYDGVQFKTKTKAVDKKVSLADFTTQIHKASLSLDGARLAAAHEGVKYCIAQYGTSRIVWQADPADPEAELRLVDDTLTVQGKCDP